MKILITGANGFIGRHLLQALRDKGHVVVAGVHSKLPRNPNLNGSVMYVDFISDTSTQIWRQRLHGFDVVINTVGIIGEHGRRTFELLHTRSPISLFRACQQTGIKRVIQVSALGAAADASSRYHRSKWLADDYLSHLSLDWVILRPSIVYGPGAKSMMFFKALSALPFIPLIGDGRQSLQPIHIKDLCDVVVQAVDSTHLSRHCLDIVGPEALEYVSLMNLLRKWLGLKDARFINIPEWLALRLAGALNLNRQLPLSAETVGMLIEGNTGDVSDTRAILGKMPAQLETWLRDSPSETSDHWFSKLFFTRFLLRISIGFVWIHTGLISMFAVPQTMSFDLLGRVGIPSHTAPYFLYGSSFVDVALGLCTVLAYRIEWIGWAQIIMILGYTAIISAFLPDYWNHPFGPISKNLPLIVSTYVMMIMEERS
ncbi:MAG: SDR family oxidoreductase [Candidatus Thiodiazotropha sp.]